MSVSFLDATAALINGLLGDVWFGSLPQGIDFVTGSLVSAVSLS